MAINSIITIDGKNPVKLHIIGIPRIPAPIEFDTIRNIPFIFFFIFIFFLPRAGLEPAQILSKGF